MKTSCTAGPGTICFAGGRRPARRWRRRCIHWWAQRRRPDRRARCRHGGLQQRAADTFRGEVVNTTLATVTQVRVEIHLSNGGELRRRASRPAPIGAVSRPPAGRRGPPVDEGATPRAVGRSDRGTRPPRCRRPDHPRSPATAERDRGYKRELYGRHGVAEYWLVDPMAETVSVHRQRAGGQRGRDSRESQAGPEGSGRSRAGRNSGRQERFRRRAAPDPPERAAERR